MKLSSKAYKLSAIAAAILLVSACASHKPPKDSEPVRNKLAQLQADPQLAGRAPVALNDAEIAVRLAETPERDKELVAHRVLIADRKVETAISQSKTRFMEDQRQALINERANARLDSRTAEADSARMQAESARMAAMDAQQKAAYLQKQAEDLQKELAEMNAKSTDRGMVVTLGDVLFATGSATLKGGVASNLDKLANFLNQHQERTVIIEGHTDSVGSEASNERLSQHRADAVKSYLAGHGIAANRLTASGMGEGSPVATNDTATGRQQNRRVEVIISNPAQ